MKSLPALLVVHRDEGRNLAREALGSCPWEVVEHSASRLAALRWDAGVRQDLDRAGAIVAALGCSDEVLAALVGTRPVAPEFAALGMLLALHPAPSALLWSDRSRPPPEPAVPFDRLAFVSPATLDAWIDAHVSRHAAEQRYAAAIEQLTEHGYAPSPAGLANAINNKDEDSVQNFLVTGVSPNACDARGVPPLHAAIRVGAWDSVALLLEHGADCNAIATDRGSTPVAEAVGAGNHELLETLITRGADIRTPSGAGQSPLMIAIGRKDEAGALALLKAGAEATGRDALGMSAHAYAKLFGLSSVLAWIAEET